MEKIFKNTNKICLLYYSLIFLLIKISLSKKILQNLKYLLSISEITITIKGSGDQYIINNKTTSIENVDYSFDYIPDKLLINGKDAGYTGIMVYNLEKEENTITMIFNEILLLCNVMFYNLTNIIYIDFSKFDSSKIIEMAGTFLDCKSLTSINLNNFNTKSVTTMHRLFYGCLELRSLDLSSFDTSNVEDMFGIFSFCSSLTSLDLSNFNTSSVTIMSVMFHTCKLIKKLDLSNFDTSLVTNFHGMFKFCSSLISININNFSTKSATNMNDMFYECSSLVFLNLYHFDTSKIRYINAMFLNSNMKMIICLNDQTSIINSLISYNKNYTNNCSDTCFTQQNIKIIKEKNICISSCDEDNTYKLEYENICYKVCPNKTHISSDKNSCEKDINENIIKEIESNIEEKENNIEEIENIDTINTNKFFNGGYNINNLTSTDKDKIKDKINNDIESGDLNLTDLILGDKKDLIIKDKTTSYQITTTENQNSSNYDDISTIQLGQCEKILKDTYGISQSLPLIIFKVDHFLPGVKISIIGYDIYNPLNKSKLDLKYCNDSIVNFQIPVSLDQNNLFKYDPKSEYYTDECFSFTTDDGTDILLNDRQNEYNNNNYSLCENNCSFVKYEKGTKKAICECQLKSKDLMISELIDEENIFIILRMKALFQI